MSYVDYAGQALQLAFSFVSFVHQHAFPLCGDLVLRLSSQWGPAQTLLATVGATPLTYATEALAVYVGAQLLVLVVRMFSSTLYRLLRFTMFMFVVGAAVVLGLYFYLTSTGGQQQARASANRFWVDQVMALAGRLAPVWDSQAGRNEWRAPPPVNFQYQPPNY
ncbi:hypothetical protein IW148_004609 [Coemansia sp. RSA 1199]|nr:hypothetical protein IW148_004609 [Coemansia sp. RSA 1199]